MESRFCVGLSGVLGWLVAVFCMFAGFCVCLFVCFRGRFGLDSDLGGCSLCCVFGGALLELRRAGVAFLLCGVSVIGYFHCHPIK